jgi:hypothetical protein
MTESAAQIESHFSQERIQENDSVVSRNKTFSGLIFGTVAGILGITGFLGFFVYLVTHMITTGLIYSRIPRVWIQFIHHRAPCPPIFEVDIIS